MLKVVRTLVSKDTLILTKWLLHLALSGQVRGVAVVFRLVDGPDEAVFTGTYRLRPASAVAAAAHMYWVASNGAEKVQREEA